VTSAQVIGLVLGLGALMVAIIGGQSFWLGRYLDVRFAAIDQRFAAIDQRFAAIDQRFAAIDRRFDAVDRRFDAVDQRSDATQRQLGHEIRAIDDKLTRFMKQHAEHEG
jgi:hypothetical protein